MRWRQQVFIGSWAMSKNWRDADDPMHILERKQNRSCMSCKHIKQQEWLGIIKWICTKGVQKSASNVYSMERCRKHYTKR